MAKFEDIRGLAERLKFLSIIFVVCVVVLLIVTSFLASARYVILLASGPINAIWAIETVISMFILMSVVLIFLSAAVWIWAGRIEKIMEESSEDIRRVLVDQAIKSKR